MAVQRDAYADPYVYQPNRDRAVRVTWTPAHESAFQRLRVERKNASKSRPMVQIGLALMVLASVLSMNWIAFAVAFAGLMLYLHDKSRHDEADEIERERLTARLWLRRGLTHDVHEMATLTERTAPPGVHEYGLAHDGFADMDEELKRRGLM